MSGYLKDKRIANAVIEINEVNPVLDKYVISSLLESIYETMNSSEGELCTG